jgi:hypothetical protein
VSNENEPVVTKGTQEVTDTAHCQPILDVENPGYGIAGSQFVIGDPNGTVARITLNSEQHQATRTMWIYIQDDRLCLCRTKADPPALDVPIEPKAFTEAWKIMADFWNQLFQRNGDVPMPPQREGFNANLIEYPQAKEAWDMHHSFYLLLDDAKCYLARNAELEAAESLEQASTILDRWWQEHLAEQGEKEHTSKPTDPLKSDEFNVHTGQEWIELINLSSDGKSGRHITTNDQRGALRHMRPGSTYFTEFVLLDEEREAGHGVELLWQAMRNLDVDDSIAWLYVSHQLAPPAPLPSYATATAWIDLDDVARKTMAGYAPTPDELVKRREKIYHAIRCGARAQVGGKRSTPYIDKQTGKVIDTEIYTSPWQIVSHEKPTQLPLWPCDSDSIPVRVELVASRTWTELTTSSDTAQYLPFGEVLGAIPGNQPGGAWARALGLAYLNWCRWHLHEALRGEVPTRGQLLDQHPAKKAPYQEILDSKDPRRALSYWHGAENYLRDSGLIEVSAKSPVTTQQRKGWQKQWLTTPPPWKPGPKLRPILEGLAQKRFVSKPRELNPAQKKPRRSRKRDV